MQEPTLESDRIVVVYERVSTDAQEIGRQESERERASADYPGAELVVVQDDGESAYKVSVFDQTGGRQMCDLIATGTVEALYVDAQDRLSRGRLAEWVNFKALCDDNGTRIMIRGRELRADDEADEMLAAFEAMRARRESAEKSHRVKPGKAHAARQGRPNGGPRRFGFDQKDGVLTPRPAEIAVVERILREAVAGRSQTEIAAGLNADGYRTARGKPWQQTQISQVMADKIWIGVLVNQEGEFQVDEPFVSSELWHAARSTRRGPDGPRRGRTTARFLLGNGLLRCGRCGYAMRVKRDVKSTGPYEVYICAGRSDAGNGCPQRAVLRASVDGAVLAYFERVGLDVEATRAELARRADRERAEIGTLRDQAERERDKVAAGLEKITRDYMLGDLPAEEYARLRPMLEEHGQAAQAALDRLATREAEVAADGTLEDVELLTRLSELRTAIAGNVTANPDDFAATHAALRRLFERFVLIPTDRAIPHDLVIAVDGEEIRLRDVPVVGSEEAAFYLQPVPRSDAVVLSGEGRIVPVPLTLRHESANPDGGGNATGRRTSAREGCPICASGNGGVSSSSRARPGHGHGVRRHYRLDSGRTRRYQGGSERIRTARTDEGHQRRPPSAVGTLSASRPRAIWPSVLPAACSARIRAATSAGTTGGRPTGARCGRGGTGRRRSATYRSISSTGISTRPPSSSTVSTNGTTLRLTVDALTPSASAACTIEYVSR
jgi:DNA invertase Pin-like site-specific DNA recombinase